MEMYVQVLKKYAEFSGRARRQEYWMFTLVNIVISLALSAVDYITGIGFLSLIYSLAVILPGLAVSVRRLHDVGKSGWWLLIAFIPLIGAIWLIVLMATDSESGSNQYGPNPKETSNSYV